MAIDSLRIEIDSLRAYAESLETNRETQERVARERFGMIRDGEIVYRIEPVER
jgi:cell division protein FtsB